MERRKAQHRCRRAPHGLARAMSSKRAPPCGAPSTLRASAETPPATRGHAQGGEPPDAIRCGVLFRPRIRAGLERDADTGGKARVNASSALSRRVLRSAPRRKRQLPVVGAGGSTSASRVAVCVTSRAGAALHSALKNASGQRPSRMKL